MSNTSGKARGRPIAVARRQRPIESAACADTHSATRLRGLAPVWNDRVRVLVLGSFPGTASLEAGQYYAHPRNHFWPLMGELLRLPLAAMPYEHRARAILAAGFGLWDTIVACAREGSLDGSIRSAEWGDPKVALAAMPQLALVCFNGQTAARAWPRWRDAGLQTAVLPSTSPAYTLPFAEKLVAWRVILDPLQHVPVTGHRY